jgi:hypothetical protein
MMTPLTHLTRESAYVFVRSGQTWNQEAKLLPSEGAALHFGASVALSGDTALISSYDRTMYVFVRSGLSWSEQAKFQGDTGHTVAIWSTASIEWRHGPDCGSSNGKRCMFVRTGTTWSQQAIRSAADVAETAFGDSVALSGDTALIAECVYFCAGSWRDDLDQLRRS